MTDAFTPSHRLRDRFASFTSFADVLLDNINEWGKPQPPWPAPPPIDFPKDDTGRKGRLSHLTISVLPSLAKAHAGPAVYTSQDGKVVVSSTDVGPTTVANDEDDFSATKDDCQASITNDIRPSVDDAENDGCTAVDNMEVYTSVVVPSAHVDTSDQTADNDEHNPSAVDRNPLDSSANKISPLNSGIDSHAHTSIGVMHANSVEKTRSPIDAIDDINTIMGPCEQTVKVSSESLQSATCGDIKLVSTPSFCEKSSSSNGSAQESIVCHPPSLMHSQKGSASDNTTIDAHLTYREAIPGIHNTWLSNSDSDRNNMSPLDTKSNGQIFNFKDFRSLEHQEHNNEVEEGELLEEGKASETMELTNNFKEPSIQQRAFVDLPQHAIGASTIKQTKKRKRGRKGVEQQHAVLEEVKNSVSSVNKPPSKKQKKNENGHSVQVLGRCTPNEREQVQTCGKGKEVMQDEGKADVKQKQATDVGDDQIITTEKKDKRKRAGRKKTKQMAKHRKRDQKNKELGIRRLKFKLRSPERKVVKECQYFIKGKCFRGNECSFSHDVVPETKSEVCKFFVKNCCLKGEECPFSHDLALFPCINFHLRGHCYAESCRFSHEPISKETLDELRRKMESKQEGPSITGFTTSSNLPQKYSFSAQGSEQLAWSVGTPLSTPTAPSSTPPTSNTPAQKSSGIIKFAKLLDAAVTTSNSRLQNASQIGRVVNKNEQSSFMTPWLGRPKRPSLFGASGLPVTQIPLVRPTQVSQDPLESKKASSDASNEFGSDPLRVSMTAGPVTRSMGRLQVSLGSSSKSMIGKPA